MDILNLLWTVLSFLLGLAWSLIWFVLRDLISTLLWILIVAWLILSVRYRSFAAGTVGILRYGRYGLRLFWRWLRGTPGALTESPARADRRQLKRARRRAPFGTMSISEQLNMLLVGAIYLLFFT
jgi:hypothetical protein